jgi:heme exporter protein D
MDVGSGVIQGQWGFVWWAYGLTWAALFGYSVLTLLGRPRQ